MKAVFNVLSILIATLVSAAAQKEIPLYEIWIPNSRPHESKEIYGWHEQMDSLTYNVSVPSLTVFLPDKKKVNGAAVVICPGGGYGVLLTKREGSDVAKEFNKLGITAFVLKYRLPSSQTMMERSVGPLQDAQQAIGQIRSRASEWGIDPSKIGIMGYSAGGHLASSLGTHFDTLIVKNFKSISVRPDFMLLINPVISFQNTFGHIGSKENLLGPGASKNQIDFFSNDLHVRPNTPPTLLIHSGKDEVVPVENSISFYIELRRHGVSAALHIYSKGEHGFLTYPMFDEWFGRCIEWMRTEGFIPIEKRSRSLKTVFPE